MSKTKKPNCGMPRPPLGRFKVLDLTRVRAGPTCVRQLADWGADVVSIEMPEGLVAGDPMGGPREGPDFQNLHRNKRSLTLNLKDSSGIAILKRLATKVDVVVENFRPSVKRRLGIDYEALSAVNPRLVYASISGFGDDGPIADRPGFDHIAQGMGGLMSITGEPERGPMRVGVPIADLCAGIFAAQGVLLALLERETSGKGQWVRTSLLEAQIFMLDFQAARWLMAGEVPAQAGNNHPTSIPTGVFRTRDGHINIAVAGQRIWARFAKALGAGIWLSDPRFATSAARSQYRDVLQKEIEARTKLDSSLVWIARLNEAGVPCGPIYTIDQVFADEQVRHLGIEQKLAGAGHLPVSYVGQPITLCRTPSAIVSHAPARGQHTNEVLKEAGFSCAEIEHARARQLV